MGNVGEFCRQTNKLAIIIIIIVVIIIMFIIISILIIIMVMTVDPGPDVGDAAAPQWRRRVTTRRPPPARVGGVGVKPPHCAATVAPFPDLPASPFFN